MARAFKACIINPDRTLNVYYITKKLKVGPNAFRPKRKADEIYIIDPKYTITTTTKRGFIPFKYTTGYYKRNIPVPIQIDEVHSGTSLAVIPEEMAEVDEQGWTSSINEELIAKYEKEGKKVIQLIKPIEVPAFSDWNYEGISSQELGTLFNPQFYVMIARANKNKKEDQMFLMQIASLAGIGFIVYYMMQNLIPAIVAALKAAHIHFT